jgi:hypothetical protein
MEVSFEEHANAKGPFVGDFEMPHYPGGMIVWLKGGGLTYYYKSSCPNSTASFALDKSIIIYNDPNHPEYTVQYNKIDKVTPRALSTLGAGWKRF